jgi:hypothetical protein
LNRSMLARSRGGLRKSLLLEAEFGNAGKGLRASLAGHLWLSSSRRLG